MSEFCLLRTAMQELPTETVAFAVALFSLLVRRSEHDEIVSYHKDHRAVVGYVGPGIKGISILEFY